MNITPLQQIIFDVLRSSGLAKQFYWTGGTLLSHYYLHHRKSFDLDFFTEQPFSHDALLPFIAELKKRLTLSEIPEKHVYDRWEFLIDTPTEQSRCEFVYYNHDKIRIAPCLTYQGLLVDSLPDLAANKTMAYIDRNEVKDLFDVYMLVSEKKFTVTELLALVKKKFGASFSEFTFWSESSKGLKNLESLRVYFLEPDKTKQDELIRTIKYFFLDRGKEFLEKSLLDS